MSPCQEKKFNVFFYAKIEILPIAQLRYSCWYAIVHLLNCDNNDHFWLLGTRWSSMEILILSPRSKLGGAKRTSRTGQEDGWGKKQKKSFLRGEFCRTKRPFFRLFWKFAKIPILIGEFLRENGGYRKNGVHHDEGNGKCKKTVISDFLFLNFRHRDFLI